MINAMYDVRQFYILRDVVHLTSNILFLNYYLAFISKDDLRLSFIDHDPAGYANIFIGIELFGFVFKSRAALTKNNDR